MECFGTEVTMGIEMGIDGGVVNASAEAIPIWV